MGLFNGRNKYYITIGNAKTNVFLDKDIFWCFATWMLIELQNAGVDLDIDQEPSVKKTEVTEVTYKIRQGGKACFVNVGGRFIECTLDVAISKEVFLKVREAIINDLKNDSRLSNYAGIEKIIS